MAPSVTASALYSVVLYAAALATTIASACRSLRRVPCDQSIYDALDDTLPSRLLCNNASNRALQDCVPKAVRKGKRAAKVAIDLNLLPYYGKPDANEQTWSTRARRGRHSLPPRLRHRLLGAPRPTLYLAMMAVRHDTPWDEIVKTLLRLARKVVPAIWLVLVDRGFTACRSSATCSGHVIRSSCRSSAAAANRTTRAVPSGTQVFFAWRKSGWGRYELTERPGQRNKAHFDVAVKVRKRVRRRPGSKRRGRRVWVYACWGVRGRSAAWVNEAYRRRRVEWLRQTYRGRLASRRVIGRMNQGRAWTTSTKPARRLLLVGLALLLRNVWALLTTLMVLAPASAGRAAPASALADLVRPVGVACRGPAALFGFRDEIETQRAFVL